MSLRSQLELETTMIDVMNIDKCYLFDQHAGTRGELKR